MNDAASDLVGNNLERLRPSPTRGNSYYNFVKNILRQKNQLLWPVAKNSTLLLQPQKNSLLSQLNVKNSANIGQTELQLKIKVRYILNVSLEKVAVRHD